MTGFKRLHYKEGEESRGWPGSGMGREGVVRTGREVWG